MLLALLVYSRETWSFRDYYVSNAAAAWSAAAAAQFCQRDNFWRIWTTFFKLDTCITHPNISDEFDKWHCRPIQNGRRRPFCQKIEKKIKFRMDLKWPEMPSKVNFGHPKWPMISEMARNAIQSDFQTSKMAAGKNKWNGQNCDQKWISEIQYGRSIWNGQKCDRKWISDIQNGWRQPFCQQSQKFLKLHIDLKWPEIRSKVIFGHPKWPTSAIL